MYISLAAPGKLLTACNAAPPAKYKMETMAQKWLMGLGKGVTPRFLGSLVNCFEKRGGWGGMNIDGSSGHVVGS